MFWQVTNIRRTFVEGNEWNAAREYLVTRPRLPGCETCPPAKEALVPAQSPTGEMFRVAGRMNIQGTFTYAYSEVRPSNGLVPTPAAPNGNYAFELLDENGNVLSSLPFAPQFEMVDHEDMVGNGPPGSEPDPQFEEEAGLILQVPLESNTASARIASQGNTLWEMDLPGTAPDIHFVDVLDDGQGNVELTWEVSDPGVPQDQLRHNIFLKESEDAPALLLAYTVTDTFFEFPTHLAPASSDARLLVRTSNGAQTDEVESAPFTIAPKPPAVRLVRPSPEDVQDMRTGVIQGQPYRFRSAAFDYTDGELADEAVVWTSSLDGVMGTGAELTTTLESAGTHVITLTATNSSELQGSDTAQIFVFADSDGDGLPDDYENGHACLDPNAPDSGLDPDMDGLTSLEEFHLGTNPCEPDTDGNGYTDGDEAAMGSDPLDPQTTPEPDGLFLPAYPAPVSLTADESCPPVAKTIPIQTATAQTEWVVSSNSPWLDPVTTQGSGDGEIELYFDCDQMIPGWNRGTIVVAAEGYPPRVVTIEVDFLPGGQESWIIQ